MAIKYTWKINSVGYAEVDGDSNVVVQVNYQRLASNRSKQVSDARVMSFEADSLAGPFTPYADLTEADIIGWIEAYEANQAVVELADGTTQTSLDRTDKDLATQLQRVDPVKADRLPWEPEVSV